MSPLMYDVKVMIQLVGRYSRIFYYRKKHGVISKQKYVWFSIAFEIIDVNKK